MVHGPGRRSWVENASRGCRVARKTALGREVALNWRMDIPYPTHLEHRQEGQHLLDDHLLERLRRALRQSRLVQLAQQRELCVRRERRRRVRLLQFEDGAVHAVLQLGLARAALREGARREPRRAPKAARVWRRAVRREAPPQRLVNLLGGLVAGAWAARDAAAREAVDEPQVGQRAAVERAGVHGAVVSGWEARAVLLNHRHVALVQAVHHARELLCAAGELGVERDAAVFASLRIDRLAAHPRREGALCRRARALVERPRAVVGV
mmetsp:Transcript_7940/g.22810  ORF Transcript_7940/g.22810 Transcript_7940/m.22810 type:complete len:267 (-) Transcript_7940:244-1044(-)